MEKKRMGKFETEVDVLINRYAPFHNGESNDALAYLQERFAGQDYRLIVIDEVLAGLIARQDVTQLPGAIFELEYLDDAENENTHTKREAIMIAEPVKRNMVDGLFMALSDRLKDGTFIALSFLTYPEEYRAEDGTRRIMIPLTLQEISDKAHEQGLVLHKWFGLRTHLDKCLMLQEENPSLTNAQAFEAAWTVPDRMDPVVRVILTKGVDMSDFPVTGI